ncbi:hypothetical protein ACFWD7_54340 [Streptomyces mirabilis]|uniref:hypothetical protein n=1 Tax=Streptomyces mirabilis TaxID=68239 RepID=UPI00367D2FF4
MPPYVSPGQRPVQVRRSAYETVAIIHVEEIAPGAGVAVGTLSRHFDNARSQTAQALDRPLSGGAAAGTIRGGVRGRTVLRALGGICAMHATEGR